MHHAFINNLYPPYVVGGNEMLCDEVVRALRARGHRVSVLCGRGVDLPSHPDLSGALSDVPLSLASLDKRRAKSLLTSPECWAPKNPAVLGVLRYLTREDPIDPKARPPVANSEYLWPLYHSIARRRAAVSKKNMLNPQGLALQALARAYPKKAKAEAHAILRKKTSTALALANDPRKVLRLCANTPEPMNA